MSIPLRFWKFRLRGMTSDAETTDRILEHAEQQLTRPDFDWLWATAFELFWMSEGNTPEAFFPRLRAVVDADEAMAGRTHTLYARHIGPREGRLAAYFESRALVAARRLAMKGV